MPLVAPVLAALTYPVGVAGLAAEVVEGGGRVFVIVEGHAFEGAVGVEDTGVGAEEGQGRAGGHRKLAEGLGPVLDYQLLGQGGG